ncbi:MAG: class I SAM-dependent methyltransferase [Verrucomicrobia bacterium]|nr:class I SAM-dependent methyltransferase [Verrucomicrobiota bacterium]
MTHWIADTLLHNLEADRTTAYRIAVGRDFWIERFGSSALISSRSEIGALPEDLLTRAENAGWALNRIFLRRLVREPGQLDVPTQIFGDQQASPREVVSESGLLYEIDFSASYSVGLFTDQRANREFVRARKPKRLLNTFAYTCAFSVAAAHVGAETVSVDVSKSSLQRGRRNFELNGIATTSHRFVPEDVPAYLRRLAKRGEKFDAVILDPPTFGRAGSGKTFRVERDFGALLAANSEIVSPGGAILLSTNFSGWTTRDLISTASGILPPETRFQIVPPPPDFFGETPSATVWALLPAP